MVAVLFFILKIIGLILLGILGLFIAVLLIVLFAPVPYRVWVSGDSDDRKQLVLWVKVFGIQVVPKRDRKKRDGKRKRGKSAKALQEERQEPADGRQEPVSDRKPAVSQSGELPAAEETSPGQAVPQLEHPVEKQEQKEQKKRKDRKSVKNREKKAEDRDVPGMLGWLRTELSDTGNRRALRLLLSETGYLLRHFGPRRVRADVSFSLGDPANTGYATAALSVCPFSYGKGCQILPDFATEQFYVRGWLDMRGHVRIIHLLLAGARLLFDKDIRKLIQKIRKK